LQNSAGAIMHLQPARLERLFCSWRLFVFPQGGGSMI
jgi:hypothetical protein